MAFMVTAQHIRFLSFILIGISIFSALGVWQIKRMAWKKDLIRTVETRVNQDAIPAAHPDMWPFIERKTHEYTHVHLSGHYLNDQETYVHTTSVYGMGFWVMTPFKTDEGFTVLINRGFAPYEKGTSKVSNTLHQEEGHTKLYGLLRISEPKGGFLRANKPKGGLWYSRDVYEILKSQGVDKDLAAPYFVDLKAKAVEGSITFPIAGLTVLQFRDNHFMYAVTWFGLALLTLIYGVVWLRR